MCEVDDVLRNLNALFATRDPFAAKKPLKLGKTMNQFYGRKLFRNILEKLIPEDQCTLNSFMQNT